MVPYKPLHTHSILTSVKLIMPPERPVRIQMSQNSNLSMLTVHKINVCNCLFLSLLFLSFPSDFLHWIFLHFLYCVKPDCQLFSKTQVPCYISVTIWYKRALKAETGPGLPHPYFCLQWQY